MGALTTVMDNNVLDAMLGDGHVIAGLGATVYIGLSTTAPAKDSTNVTEPSGAGYARVAVANTTVQWPNATGGAKSNANQITFPAATGAWGTVGYWVMYDALTAGNLRAFGTLTAGVAVTAGITPDFPAGAFILGAD